MSVLIFASYVVLADVDMEGFKLEEAGWKDSWDGRRALLRPGSTGCILPQYRDEVQKLLLANEVEAANEAYGDVCLQSRKEMIVIILGEHDTGDVFAMKLVVIGGRRVWVYQTSLTCCYVPKE